MVHPIVLAVTIVLEVGSSAVGTTGMLAEHLVKLTDKESFPTARKVAEIFTKTLQNAAAAFSLVILGSLFVNPAGILAASAIGLAIVLSPYVKAAMEYSENTKLKKLVNIYENVANISAKTINTAIFTTGVGLALGIPAAIIVGAGVGALNVMAYVKG